MTQHRRLQKSQSVFDILKFLDKLAPPATAEDWDPVGLLLGDGAIATSGVVLAIDLSFEAVHLAVQRNYSLILTHHPCIFPKKRGLSQFLAGTPMYEAVRNGVAVAAYHTNFDRSALEVVQSVSRGLGLEPRGRFFELSQYVGQYVGEPVGQGIVPYSDPLFGEDQAIVESAKAPSGIVRGHGYGFWGEFHSSKPFADLVKDVKSLFNIHGFWITNPVPSSVARVGFVAGKGASFVDAAVALKCDLLITGEAGYHTALSGSRRGVTVLELGHRESERFFIETMKVWLSELNIEIAEVQTPTQKIL